LEATSIKLLFAYGDHCKGLALAHREIAFLTYSLIIIIKGVTAMWTKPAYKEIRVGFEVTMYCYAR